MSPEPPKVVASPDYPEKHVVDLRRYRTDEIDLNMLKREAKQRAKRRPQQLYAGIAAIITALGGAAVGIIKALSAHERADVHEYRMGQAEEALRELQHKTERTELHLAGCCGEKDHR